MGFVVEELINILLELINDLMGWAIHLVEDLQIDIGFTRTTEYETIGQFINPIDRINRTTGIFDGLLGRHAVNFVYIFWIMGFVLCIFFLMFKVLFAMFDSTGKNSEHPATTAARFIIAFGGVAYSYSIFIVLERMANYFFKMFRDQMHAVYGNIDSTADFYHMFTQDAYPETAIGRFQVHKMAIAVICLFLGSVILTEFIKLIFEFYQRYVLLGALFYTAPLAFSTLVSKNSKVFSSWLQMVICQFIVLAMTLFFLTTFASAMINISQGKLYTGSDQKYYTEEQRGAVEQALIDTAISTNPIAQGIVTITGQDTSIKEVEVSKDADVPKWAKYMFNDEYQYVMYMLLLASWLIIGQRVDEIMRNMGLSAARTGQALGGHIMSSIFMAASMGRMAFGLGKTVATKGAIVGSHMYSRTMAERKATQGYMVSSKFMSSLERVGSGVYTNASIQKVEGEMAKGAIIPGTPDNTSVLGNVLNSHNINMANVTGGNSWNSISSDGQHITIKNAMGETVGELIPMNGEYSVSEGGHVMTVGDGTYGAVVSAESFEYNLNEIKNALNNSSKVDDNSTATFVTAEGWSTEDVSEAVGVGIFKEIRDENTGEVTSRILDSDRVYALDGTGSGTTRAHIENHGVFAENNVKFETYKLGDITGKGLNANGERINAHGKPIEISDVAKPENRLGTKPIDKMHESKSSNISKSEANEARGEKKFKEIDAVKYQELNKDVKKGPSVKNKYTEKGKDIPKSETPSQKTPKADGPAPSTLNQGSTKTKASEKPNNRRSEVPEARYNEKDVKKEVAPQIQRGERVRPNERNAQGKRPEPEREGPTRIRPETKETPVYRRDPKGTVIKNTEVIRERANHEARAQERTHPMGKTLSQNRNPEYRPEKPKEVKVEPYEQVIKRKNGG